MKLIITKGLPGSGKTTWARKWISEDPSNRVRVNRDDIRNMLGNYWQPSREQVVTEIEDQAILAALEGGFEVVVDATNFRGLDRFINLTARFKPSEFELALKNFTDVPLEECIDRDSSREKPVGADVIRQMHKKYLKQNG